jgi:hypothetical protein
MLSKSHANRDRIGATGEDLRARIGTRSDGR